MWCARFGQPSAGRAGHASTEIVTTEAGLFTAPLLPAGTSTITVTLSGFCPFKRTGIAVAATETVRVPDVTGLTELARARIDW